MRAVFAFLITLFVAVVVLPAQAQAGDDWDFNIHLLMAKRQLGTWDDRNFSQETGDFKDQDVSGVEIDFGGSLWPANIWVGYTRSVKSIAVQSIDFESTLTMNEYYVGARANLIGFFVSGAAASIGGEFSGHTGSERHSVIVDREVGLLLNAGVEWSLLHLSVALDARAITGTKHNDYAQLGLKAGLSF